METHSYLLFGALALLFVKLSSAQSDACYNYGKMTCHQVFKIREVYQDCGPVERKRRQVLWGQSTAASPTPTRCPLARRIVEKKSKIFEKVLDKIGGTFTTPGYPNTTAYNKVVCRIKVCGPSSSSRYRIQVHQQYMKPKSCFGKMCMYVKGKYKVCCYRSNCDIMLSPIDTRGHRLIVELTHDIDESERPCEGGMMGYYVQFDPSQSLNGLPQASVSTDKFTGEKNLTCPCSNDESSKQKIVGFGNFGSLSTQETTTSMYSTVFKTEAPGDDGEFTKFKQVTPNQRTKRQGSPLSLSKNKRVFESFLCRLFGGRYCSKPIPPLPKPTTAPPLTSAFPSASSSPPSPTSISVPTESTSTHGTSVSSPSESVPTVSACPVKSCVAADIDDPDEKDFVSDFRRCDQPFDLSAAEGDSFSLRYYFNSTSGECEEVDIADHDVIKCDNSETPMNCYQTLASCQRECTNVCLLPQSTGTGNQTIEHYYYDKKENSCKSFDYKGSGGTANNFRTPTECQKECGLFDLGIDDLTKCLDESATSTCANDPKLKCLFETMMQCSTTS